MMVCRTVNRTSGWILAFLSTRQVLPENLGWANMDAWVSCCRMPAVASKAAFCNWSVGILPMPVAFKLFYYYLSKPFSKDNHSQLSFLKLRFLPLKDLGTPSEKIWPNYNELPAVKKMTFTDYPYNNLRKRFGALLSDQGFDLMNKWVGCPFRESKQLYFCWGENPRVR